MSGDAPGFFSRWSQRKAGKQPVAPAEPNPGALPAERSVSPSGLTPVAGALPATALQGPEGVDTGDATPPVAAQSPTSAGSAVPLPTLEDVAKLRADSDFSPFVSRGVAPAVKNAAMKKLFADPHFNVMDGLDIYIDDYSIPSPLSEQDLKKMVAAQFIKLVDEEPPPVVQPPVSADARVDANADVTGKTDAAAEAAPDHPPSSAPDGVAVAPADSHLPDAAEQPSAAFTPAPDGAGTSFPLASPES